MAGFDSAFGGAFGGAAKAAGAAALPLPSLTLAPGGGGPSGASGTATGGSLDSTGWAVNIGGQQTASNAVAGAGQRAPVPSGYGGAAAFGLPGSFSAPIGTVGAQSIGGIPVLWIALGLVAIVALRRKH